MDSSTTSRSTLSLLPSSSPSALAASALRGYSKKFDDLMRLICGLSDRVFIITLAGAPDSGYFLGTAYEK